MRLAIWGSCVTRDALEIRTHLFDSVEYFARTSWVSQASPRPAVDVEIGPELTGKFGERMVQEDLGREVLDRISAVRPDLVVFDLIDERFDLLHLGTGWVTESDYYRQTPMSDRDRDRVDERNLVRSPRRAELFESAVPILARRIVEEMPDVPLLLHAAYYTPIITTDQVTLYANAARDAVSMNEALAGFGRSLQREFGERLQVFTPRPEVQRTDPGHRWGLSMYHYEHAYYVDLLDAMEAVAARSRHPQVSPMAAIAAPPRIVNYARSRVPAPTSTSISAVSAPVQSAGRATRSRWLRLAVAMTPVRLRRWVKTRRR